VLIVDDDSDTRSYLKNSLAECGHTVEACEDGVGGLETAREGVFDLVIVDRMMPRMDGVSFVKAMRTSTVPPPVLMLTAMGSVSDRVEGLEAGADDYLVKPFSFSELHARINALARRPSLRSQTLAITVGDLVLDRLARTVRRGAREIELQPREYQLLEVLVLNAGRIVTRAMLLEHVWRLSFDPKSNLVESHISRLRTKLDRMPGAPTIRTVRGEGYVLRAD
jgi:two-component system OmpR family response regulator